MSAVQLITALERAGLRLGLDDTGGLRCYGDRAKVSAYLPIIRQHKPAILRTKAFAFPAVRKAGSHAAQGLHPFPIRAPSARNPVSDNVNLTFRAPSARNPAPKGGAKVTRPHVCHCAP